MNFTTLMKFSSLAAPEVVRMTTSSAANDENFLTTMTFWFPCKYVLYVTDTIMYKHFYKTIFISQISSLKLW